MQLIKFYGLPYDRIALPFGNFTRPITALRYIVECLAKFASIASRLFAVDAHIEKLAVLWISVAGMRYSNGFIDFWACERE